MKNNLLAFSFLLLIYSCSKQNNDSASISSAEFTVSKNLAYAFEPITIQAVDTTGKLAYDFDFGDGNHITGGSSVVHKYQTGGTYKITMHIYGKSFTKEIRILPGVLSYQIKNVTNRELNILSYLDNYHTGAVLREDYRAGKTSDTLYYASPQVTGLLHLFGASIFINNLEYQLYSGPSNWFQEKKHTIFEIRDSTQVSPRVGGGTPAIFYLKDL